MLVSTYLQTLERVEPSRYNALLVYAPNVVETAPLIARFTGLDLATVAQYLYDNSRRDYPVVRVLERRASSDEIKAAGMPFTKRLLHRAAHPHRTCGVTLCVTPVVSKEACDALATRLNGQQRGVMVVRGACPPEHKRTDTDRVPKTVIDASAVLSFDVLEVSSAV